MFTHPSRKPEVVNLSLSSRQERAWGMDYCTLHINTRFNNIFCTSLQFLVITFTLTSCYAVRADLHILFNGSFWILIPQSDVVAAIYEQVKFLKSGSQPRSIVSQSSLAFPNCLPISYHISPTDHSHPFNIDSYLVLLWY